MEEWERVHEEEVPQGGKALGPEEKTLLMKKALLAIIIILMALYIVLWAFGMLESLWTGIISGLLLVVLLVLALVTRYRK